MNNILVGPAIVTRYFGPTNVKGSRVVATSMADGRARRATVAWDSGWSEETNHIEAAREWLKLYRPILMSANPVLITARMPDKTGNMVHLVR